MFVNQFKVEFDRVRQIQRSPLQIPRNMQPSEILPISIVGKPQRLEWRGPMPAAHAKPMRLSRERTRMILDEVSKSPNRIKAVDGYQLDEREVARFVVGVAQTVFCLTSQSSLRQLTELAEALFYAAYLQAGGSKADIFEQAKLSCGKEEQRSERLESANDVSRHV